MKNLSANEAQALLQSGQALQVVDIRSPQETLYFMLPGAINIPMDQFPEALTSLRKDVPILLYCRRGIRSSKLYEHIKDTPQLPEVFLLTGGLEAWKRDVDPDTP